LEAEPEPLGYHLLEAQWLRAITRAAPDALAVVMVDGDSMEPTLWNRDWVLLDTTQRRIQRQGVFALRFHDTVWVKRLQPSFSRQSIRILSDNAHYEPDEAAEADLSVIGRVVALVARSLA
jgi:phage repressor protein C with HTH and peptisase S24 domain